MLFDGLLGEKASPHDGSLDLLVLREEEINFVQKFLKIIRSNPEKTQSVYKKLHKMLKEEEKANQDGLGTNHMGAGEPPSMRRDTLRVLHKRGAEKKMKLVNKKHISKREKIDKTKKKDKNVQSKTEKYGAKQPNKKRKLGKKGKSVAKKGKNKLDRKKKRKINCISKMKQIKQKRKEVQEDRQKTKFLVKNEELENCTSLWAELTSVGLGVATTLKKQVNGN